MDDVAVLIGKDLDFDVPRIRIARSTINSSDPNARAASERAPRKRIAEFLGSSHKPHAAPAAAGRSLDHQRKPMRRASAVSFSSD